mgnify:CR=1 FL=1|jgi:dTDP-6-deoxy-L-talose 4-dehydrogenase (NAD+)
MTETVLVTGASGYIGRHVVDALTSYDCKIIVADPRANEDDTRYQVVRQPIFEDDEQLFQDLGSPDRCIHLAWKDGFNHNSFSHLKTLPLHLRFISRMVSGGIKSLSIMGSMHEVGYWEGPIDEKTPCDPESFYGIAKNALRQASMIVAKNSNTKLKWLRGFYVTGDDENSNSVFGKLVKAANAGAKSFPFTSGKNQYDFIDVDELAQQIVAASMQDSINGIINCCSGKPLPLGERMEQFITEHGFDIKLNYGAFPDRPYDSPGVWGNATKISEIMNANR